MPTVERILAFDLETTNLKGNFGHILVACAKWVGEDKFAFSRRIDQCKGYGKTPKSYINDRAIVQQLVELINESQAIVAHYGRWFDQPFLTTRALVHGLQPPKPVKLLDTWKYARNQLALTSNRLETVSHALGCKHTKFKLPFEVWQLAAHGDRKLLKEMQGYCENDVDTLIDTYLKMRPIIYDHPNVTGASMRAKKLGDRPSCTVCTKQPPRMNAQGWRITKCYRIRQWQCQNCGSWISGRQEKL